MQQSAAGIIPDTAGEENISRAAENSRLAGEYIRLVYKICVTHLAPPLHTYADDACQQVFLNFLSSQPNFGERAQEKAWFVRTAVNVCKNIKRQSFYRAGRTAPLEAADHMLSGSSQYMAADLSGILALLPEKLRTAFVLVCLEGYTAEETAALTGTSEGAVRMNVSRARKKLRKYYAEEEL